MTRELWNLLAVMLIAAGSNLSALAQLSCTDDLDRAVSMPGPAQRIVSLAPSITETLFALGAADQLAGVTDFCNYPADATKKPRVGGMVNPSIETIVRLRPDLVILSMEGNVRDDFSKLQSLGIPLFVTNPRTLDGVIKSVLDLGTLTGKGDRAAELAEGIRTCRDSISVISRATRKKTALLLVSLQPLIVVGGKNYLNELLALAGALNLAADAPSTYPTLSREAVVSDNPDVIFFTSDLLSAPENLVKVYPEWQHLEAMRRGNVYRVDADLISRPGPRAPEALIMLHTLIHTHSK